MTRVRTGAILLTTLLAVAGLQLSGTRAEETAVEAAYELERFGEGYLRVNRQTGSVSFCRLVTGNLVCRVAAEEREAYEETIARLEDRMATIEERLAAIESTSGNSDNRPMVDDKSVGEEVDRAFEFAEQAMRRFFDSVKEMRQELEEDNSAD